VANAGISYIRNRLNLRASFNYRGRYLVTYNVNPTRSVYAAARPTLDIKTLFKINRHIGIYLDVVNVFMEPDRERVFGIGRPQVTHLMAPQFYFGVNLRN
jgi:outer membrane cobalamin receptor